MLMIAFLVLWWASAFSALGWMFATAAAPPSFRMFSIGVYVELDMPSLIRAAEYLSPASSIAK
jgi:hypothetical protein